MQCLIAAGWVNQGGKAHEPYRWAGAPRREGAMFGAVALVRDTGAPVKANLALRQGVLAAIDAAAGRTRSAMVEALAQAGLPLVG